MKKYGILVVLGILCLTGCGNNRLVCTMKTSGTNFEITKKYTFTFSKDKVSKATMQTTTTLLEELNTKENLDIYYQSAQTAAEEYNSVKGIEAKTSANKNKVSLSVKIKAAALSEEDKEKYVMNASREETKKILEEDDYGFTCK